MTTRSTGSVEVSADALRLLLQCAGQTLDAYSEDEYGQRLQAAVSEGVSALETPPRPRGGAIDPELKVIIWDALNDAYECAETASDDEMCTRIRALTHLFVVLRRARSEALEAGDSYADPMTVLESIRSGERQAVAELMRMACAPAGGTAARPSLAQNLRQISYLTGGAS